MRVQCWTGGWQPVGLGETDLAQFDAGSLWRSTLQSSEFNVGDLIVIDPVELDAGDFMEIELVVLNGGEFVVIDFGAKSCWFSSFDCSVLDFMPVQLFLMSQ